MRHSRRQSRTEEFPGCRDACGRVFAPGTAAWVAGSALKKVGIVAIIKLGIRSGVWPDLSLLPSS